MKKIPDFGTIAVAVHANAPNPGHAHCPGTGDVRVYKLLWMSQDRVHEVPDGKEKTAYVIYERGAETTRSSSQWRR